MHGIVLVDILPTYFLTIKAHKIPQTVRGVTSVCGTPISGLARTLSKVQSALIPVVHEIWNALCTLCGLAAADSWIVTDASQVPKRMKQAYKFREAWLELMTVFDFTSMYDKFVHFDIKHKLGLLI